jgi:hypothetical protein
MGKDAYERLKAAIRKLSKIKPDHWGQGIPPEITNRFPLDGVLVWGHDFQDLRALLILPLSSDQVDQALDALPDALDRAYANAGVVGDSRQRFVRLNWYDGRWNAG